MKQVTSMLPALLLAMMMGAGSAWGQDTILVPKIPDPAYPIPNASLPGGGVLQDCLECPEKCPLRWYIQADAIYMQRYAGTGQPLLRNVPNTASILTARNFDFDWELGPRLTVGAPLGECGTVELSYFGLFDMNANLASAGVARPIGLTTLTGTNFAVNYDSQIHNGEINYRRSIGDQFSLLAGFRYMNWSEDMTGSFQAVLAGTPVVPFRFSTDNNLYGLQLGGNWSRGITERLGFDLGTKAAIFYNDASMNAFANIPGLGARTPGASTERTAFMGEVNLLARYRLTDHVLIRGGYQAMWVEGIALAPDQIGTTSFTGTSSVSGKGGTLLHGAIGGLEIRW